jgi:putative membrane protein
VTTPAPEQTAEAALLARDAHWRRLDVRMLLVHPVNELVRFLPALVAVFVVGSTSGRHDWWHVAAVAVPVALGLLRFLTTSFRISDGQLELRRGLVSRNTLTAPLDRVRTVELTASPIHRVLGLARVRIGTGSATKSGREKLELDALSLAEARTMRAALLHRAPVVPTGGAADRAEPRSGGGTLTPAVLKAPPDEVLLRLDPTWLRFAPLTTSGLVIALGALGATSQFSGQVLGRVADDLDLGKRAATASVWVAVPAGLVAFVVVISVLAVLGYALTNWGFTLSRDRAGRSFHVTRGLLTARETSIETARLRGVEVHEPLGLRLAGGGRLSAIVTGLNRRESGSAPLVPPAPRTVVTAVGGRVLDEDRPLTVPLRRHGPAARRRRFLRAVAVALVVSAGWVVLAVAAGWPGPAYVVAALPPVAGAALAADRYRRLGHALTAHHLVVRKHSFRGRRDALQRDGIIGWNLRQTWFQRRAGLATLVATTSAGRQAYSALDVPEGDAVALARAVTPDLLEPFLSRPR